MGFNLQLVDEEESPRKWGTGQRIKVNSLLPVMNDFLFHHPLLVRQIGLNGTVLGGQENLPYDHELSLVSTLK